MLELFDGLRDLTFANVAIRMLVAVLCGGVIGLERAYKHRPAGLRTHILICMGAAMTTMTSQYLVEIGYFTDLARLGAQVIAGIGFIGAGTISITKHQHVKGLTTAAGLWCAAIIGLAVGSGYIEGALAVTVLILIAEIVFSKLVYRMLKRSPDVIMYIEFSNKNGPEQVLRVLHDCESRLENLEITKRGETICAIMNLHVSSKFSLDYVMQQIRLIPEVVSAETL